MKTKYEKIRDVIDEVGDEIYRARTVLKHPPMNSAHEGYAVLKEEVDELWDDIKNDDYENARDEAVQVAAMAAALVVEVFGEE